MLDTSKQRLSLLTLALLIILTIAIRLPILMEPWGADQAGFGYVARAMLDGKVPYKDVYSLTGYGIFFTFALFFELFGTTMVSVHVGHLLVSLFTVILVFCLSHRLYGMRQALIATLCYTLFSNGLAFSGCGYENRSFWGTYWYLSQREVFMAPLIMAAILLTIVAQNKNGSFLYLITGILTGLAAFYKLTAVLMLLLFVGFVACEHFLNRTSFSLRKPLGRIFCLFVGFMLIQLPFLYYFWSHNALNDMYQALFVHVALYAKLSRGLRIETLFSGHYSIMSENLLLWLFACISCLYMLFKDRTRNNLLIILWALGSLLMVWGQGKFFGYHFILLVPPFAVLTGYAVPTFFAIGSGLSAFFRDALTDIRKTFILTTAMLTFVAFGISNYDYYKRHILYFIGRMSEERYYDVFNEFPTHPYSFRSDYQIASYLRDIHQSGDRLGVIFSAGDTIIHFLTGMEPATKFLQSWYLFSSDKLLSNSEITVNLRRAFVDQMINAAPRFILCVHIPLEEIVQLPSLKDDPSVKKLYEFIHAHYRVEAFPDNRFLFEKV